MGSIHLHSVEENSLPVYGSYLNRLVVSLLRCYATPAGDREDAADQVPGFSLSLGYAALLVLPSEHVEDLITSLHRVHSPLLVLYLMFSTVDSCTSLLAGFLLALSDHYK